MVPDSKAKLLLGELAASTLHTPTAFVIHMRMVVTVTVG